MVSWAIGSLLRMCTFSVMVSILRASFLASNSYHVNAVQSRLAGVQFGEVNVSHYVHNFQLCNLCYANWGHANQGHANQGHATKSSSG